MLPRDRAFNGVTGLEAPSSASSCSARSRSIMARCETTTFLPRFSTRITRNCMLRPQARRRLLSQQRRSGCRGRKPICQAQQCSHPAHSGYAAIDWNRRIAASSAATPLPLMERERRISCEETPVTHASRLSPCLTLSHCPRRQECPCGQ